MSPGGKFLRNSIRARVLISIAFPFITAIKDARETHYIIHYRFRIFLKQKETRRASDIYSTIWRVVNLKTGTRDYSDIEKRQKEYVLGNERLALNSPPPRYTAESRTRECTLVFPARAFLAFYLSLYLGRDNDLKSHKGGAQRRARQRERERENSNGLQLYTTRCADTCAREIRASAHYHAASRYD